MLWFQYPSVALRFDAKVDRNGDCHVWTSTRMPNGYGRFRISRPVRSNEYAHRLALERKLGRALRPGETSRHTCDNPPCVREDHLVVGTQLDNVADRVRRHRSAHGERQTTACLTEQAVREIVIYLNSGELTHREIAARYGVARATVSQIKSGRTWAHVPR